MYKWKCLPKKVEIRVNVFSSIPPLCHNQDKVFSLISDTARTRSPALLFYNKKEESLAIDYRTIKDILVFWSVIVR